MPWWKKRDRSGWAFDDEVKAVCKRALDSPEQYAKAGLVEVFIARERDLVHIAKSEFQNVAQPVAAGEKMFCAIGLVWAKYFVAELPSDSDLFFVIKKLEG